MIGPTSEQLNRYDECTLGGPGLDGYAFNADVWCTDCAHHILFGMAERGELPDPDSPEFSDSDCIPQPIFFGESDSPQFCSGCGDHLYGEEQEEE